MPFHDAGDAAIYYDSEGDGSPLVLLHGYALNGLMWEFQRPAFAKSHKVVTVDLRGFGKSSCGRSWSGQVMAEDVMGLIESLKLEDVTVLGFSMSGPVAIRAAYEMPAKVRRLILASSILPSGGRPKAGSQDAMNREELEVLRLRGILAWADFIGLSRGPLVDNMFKRNPDIAELWKRMISRHNPDFLLRMMTARLAAVSEIDWRARLGEIKQPAAIIAGAQDSQFLDASRRLARDMPDARLTVIKGAGHMVNLEAPREFEEAVLQFSG